MASKLVVVESPTKARTLKDILGKSYTVKASMGHVRDLPKKELGIDLTNFAPTYTVLPAKKKFLKEFKEAASGASAIYLATDPDREGEAIAWHLVEAIKPDKKIPIRRVVFHEITKEAIKQAFEEPKSIDMQLVEAQQARRLLDRLVGYKLSPLLWRKVIRGLSAGRVQSVTVKLIVDREREIQGFVPSEYWTIEVELAKTHPGPGDSSFGANLVSHGDGSRVNIASKASSEDVVRDMRTAAYSVKDIKTKIVARQPAPPFTTSTLQQEAWRKLRFSAQRTMAIAQQLYEGLDIGEGGAVGLITYMRTDSTHLAASAITDMRDFIKERYGVDFLPSKPRAFATKKKWTQEAHEAIRPTSALREPSKLAALLDREQLRLYELIWRRAIASQMSAATFDTVTVDILAGTPKRDDYLLRAASSTLKFSGFTILYSEGRDDEEEEKEGARLPKLEKGEKLTLEDIVPQQHFTEPLPRYNEATLIKALEQKGIGRPSTYAPILSTIQERDYVKKDKGKFQPDELGFIVTDLLAKHFPKIVDPGFTADMEEQLDEVARGRKDRVTLLKDFYKPFEETLAEASTKIEKVSITEPSDQLCPECGKPMVVKRGRFGKFLTCSDYPTCKGKMPFRIGTGARCPECGQELVQRKGRKNRPFYGCSAFPKCKFATPYKPLKEPCPSCGKLLVTLPKGLVKCTACGYRKRSSSESEGVEDGNTPVEPVAQAAR